MTDESLAPSGLTHLVILVHGINTRAQWTSEIMPALEEAGVLVEATSYGKYSVLRFLLPFKFLRWKAEKRVLVDIREAIRLHRPEKISIIAHSFGTYLVSQIIANNPDLQFHRIIFCGSVLRESFPFGDYMQRFTTPILNEVGTRDFWPAVAESLGWGYGSIGSYGANRPGTRTRYHRGFSHSQFLKKAFAVPFWIPFLTRGEIVRGDEWAPMWWPVRVITALPLRYLPIVLVLATLVFGFVPHSRTSQTTWERRTEQISCIFYPSDCGKIPMDWPTPKEMLAQTGDITCGLLFADCGVDTQLPIIRTKIRFGSAIASIEFVNADGDIISKVSGFIVSRQGEILTFVNFGEQNTTTVDVRVRFFEQQRPNIGLISRYSFYRGAGPMVLSVNPRILPETQPLRIPYAPAPPQGTEVWTIDFPPDGNQRQIKGRVLPGETLDPDAVRSFVTDLSLDPERIGSPVFDSSNAVVGIVTSARTQPSPRADVKPLDGIRFTIDGL
jgi:pimeloyl-ACP methyl ester carboxylesterase